MWFYVLCLQSAGFAGLGFKGGLVPRWGDEGCGDCTVYETMDEFVHFVIYLLCNAQS